MTGYHEIDSLDESKDVIANDESDLKGFGILYINHLNLWWNQLNNENAHYYLTEVPDLAKEWSVYRPKSHNG